MLNADKLLKGYAPVICNHLPTPNPRPPPTGNSGDNDFSSTTALLKALYCGNLMRAIALLFIRVNSTGYIYVISQARHLPGTAGELKRSLPRTLAPLSPAHPRRLGGGQGLQMTGALPAQESVHGIGTPDRRQS